MKDQISSNMCYNKLELKVDENSGNISDTPNLYDVKVKENHNDFSLELDVEIENLYLNQAKEKINQSGSYYNWEKSIENNHNNHSDKLNLNENEYENEIEINTDPWLKDQKFVNKKVIYEKNLQKDNDNYCNDYDYEIDVETVNKIDYTTADENKNADKIKFSSSLLLKKLTMANRIDIHFYNANMKNKLTKILTNKEISTYLQSQVEKTDEKVFYAALIEVSHKLKKTKYYIFII